MVKLSPRDFGGRRLTNSTEDFHEFTAKVYDLYTALRGHQPRFCSAINQHFAPQACLCGLSQGLEYDYLLKLEEQGAWYPGFVKLAGLEHFVREGWAPDVGGSADNVSFEVFTRATSLHCYSRMFCPVLTYIQRRPRSSILPSAGERAGRLLLADARKDVQ